MLLLLLLLCQTIIVQWLTQGTAAHQREDHQDQMMVVIMPHLETPPKPLCAKGTFLTVLLVSFSLSSLFSFDSSVNYVTPKIITSVSLSN